MGNDYVLLEAWRAGDREAGNTLFTTYFPSVRRFFINKVDRSALEDLIQQTFMACVEGLHRVRNGNSFRSYLFGAAHNILRVHYRAAARTRNILDVDALSVAELGTGPSTIIGKRREQRLLLEALRRSPLADQVLLELYYWEQLSGSQLGEFLGVPENTARTRLRRARIRLEARLRELAEDQELLKSTINGLELWAAGVREHIKADGARAG